MASPVIINSSSPGSIHMPSITPPSKRDNNKNARSSSPGLPSPSELVQAKASELRNGSGAQAVPAQAGFGFASVGNLWREKKFEDDTRRDERSSSKQKAVPDVPDRAKKRASSKKVDTTRDADTGKLKKPKMATRSDAGAATDGKGQITFELQDFVFGDDAQHAEKASGRAKPSKTVMQPPKQASESRRPSMDLSEYAFGVYDLGMQTQAPANVQAAKKTRKKAATSRQTRNETTAAKKAHKGKAKPDAVTLDSDSPANNDAQDSNEQMNSARLQDPGDSRPRKKKESKAKSAGDQTHGPPVEIAGNKVLEEASLTSETEPEKSLYFAPGHIADDTNATSNNLAEDTEPTPNPEQVIGDLEKAADFAPCRRKDWTPVKDTSAPVIPDAMALSTHGGPRPQFTNLLGDFGYEGANIGVPQARRTVSGESLTKRRRIEVGGKGLRGPVARELQKKDDPVEPKEKKKKPTGRKKLPTITALATSAYQPELDQPTEQSTVSEFFVPRKEKDLPLKETASVPEKPKKPRKPKKKKKKDDTADTDKTTAASTKKSKKAKVKFNETAYLTKLHSPARATSQMMQQEFLFGTSSQLAVDEPPAFIRDMQAAVQASEMDAGRPRRDQPSYQIQSSNFMLSQPITTPRRSKSCAKVPTAPHGTCLSLQQAHRELWCVSSRGDDGGFLRDLSKEDTQVMTKVNDATNLDQPDTLRKLEQADTSKLSIQQETLPETTARGQSVTCPASRDFVPEPLQELEPADDGSFAALPNENHRGDNDIVELSHSSPIAPSEDAEDFAIALVENAKDSGFSKENAPQEQAETGSHSHDTQNDDSWMLISSEGPELGAKSPWPSRPEHSTPSVSDSHPPVASKIIRRRSPFYGRDILQPLDANASIHSPAALRAAPVDHARAFATSASDKSPTGRPRGRPRKEAGAPVATAPSRKKRGRPRKHPVTAADPSPETATFKKAKAAVSTSQPLQSPPGWLDVDEISDSDSPVTPSPPRRRASASPHATPPLDITVDGSPLTKLDEKGPAIVSATSTFKPGEPQWPAIRGQVFNQIYSAIKDASHGADPSKPSWYQKILMYDPITLEELTGWLNQQGLRIQVHKQKPNPKPKPKKRGRKKRDADGNVLEEEGNAAWEIHEEKLQAWMVQKWCEEKSICCVWAGGGWGGRAKR